jgi:hypothetical protein
MPAMIRTERPAVDAMNFANPMVISFLNLRITVDSNPTLYPRGYRVKHPPTQNAASDDGVI